jgi:hypothetical protein
MRLRAAIARASDEMMEEGRMRSLAQQLAQSGLENAQLRNLENLAYTTDKISDLTDLLKKLIARDTRSRTWAMDNAGQELIAAIESLRGKAEKIKDDETTRYEGAVVDADLVRRLHLELCREFVKHLVAEFMYRKAKRRKGRNG